MTRNDQVQLDAREGHPQSNLDLDEQYALWRQQQIDLMDRQYRQWRKNPLQTFPKDFEAWRRSQESGDALISEEAVAHPHHGLAVDELPLTLTGSSTSVGLATSNPDATSGHVSR